MGGTPTGRVGVGRPCETWELALGHRAGDATELAYR